MLENTKHPYYYYVGLEVVIVGKNRITAPLNMITNDGKGNGGMVVDSVMTYYILPEDLYNFVVGEFGKSGNKRARGVMVKTRARVTTLISMFAVLMPQGPQLVLHFGGNSSAVMPKKNYFYKFTNGKKVKRKVGCMTSMNAGYFLELGGPVGLLGNYQQQGLEVVYDLLNKRVAFARRKDITMLTLDYDNSGCDKEDRAVRSSDLAALKYCRLTKTLQHINSKIWAANYATELEEIKNVTKQEILCAILALVLNLSQRYLRYNWEMATLAGTFRREPRSGIEAVQLPKLEDQLEDVQLVNKRD
nr:probable aspartyl protease At4g16563 [Tanacetum cinerariifolium]